MRWPDFFLPQNPRIHSTFSPLCAIMWCGLVSETYGRTRPASCHKRGGRGGAGHGRGQAKRLIWPENRMVTSFEHVLLGIGLMLKRGYNHDGYLLSGIFIWLGPAWPGLARLVSSTDLSSSDLSSSDLSSSDLPLIPATSYQLPATGNRQPAAANGNRQPATATSTSTRATGNRASYTIKAEKHDQSTREASHISR